MNLLKRISQIKSLLGVASKEAMDTTRRMHESQLLRNKAAVKLQGFQTTYNSAIQTHSSLLSGNKSVNPQLLSNTQTFLDKLQRDIDNTRRVVNAADADIIKYENLLLKLLAKQKGYQKVTDNYVQYLRIANEKREYLDSVKESSRDEATLL